jgi:hypothetical protein
MKHTIGFAKVTLLLLVSFLSTGCASFFEFDDPMEPGNVDRGYEAQNCDTEDCTPHRLSSNERKREPAGDKFAEAVEARDVVLGMTRDQVLRSWGAPAVRELAGQRNEGHERWHYGTQFSLQGERIVIFENGQVAGWYR